MNTRYERTKTRLINLRNTAITQLMAVDPSYKPPAIFAYKNSALEDKIEIPQEQYPQYNFMVRILNHSATYSSSFLTTLTFSFSGTHPRAEGALSGQVMMLLNDDDTYDDLLNDKDDEFDDNDNVLFSPLYLSGDYC